jgi:hypothetical protein
MSSENKSRQLKYRTVRYTLLKGDQFVIVENVPARVDVETGEEYFSPQTVEQLQKIIVEQDKPVRTIKTPVYDYS